MGALVRRLMVTMAAVATTAGMVLTAGPPAAAQAAGGPASPAPAGSTAVRLPRGVSQLCPAPRPGLATCDVLVSRGRPAAVSRPGAAAATPAGFAPADLRSAYAAPADSAGMRETVAVVTAYDDPTAEADMAAYRTQYSLPACSATYQCFRKVDENGGAAYPPVVAGWAGATAESLDMISALCPNCHILLVEATSPAITDLGAAENTAVSLGARIVENTFYTPEATYGASEPSYDSSYFSHPGIAITAPAGDSGYGVSYPAASPDVTAVGGTTLTRTGTGVRGFTETAESGTGSGCSAYEPKPSWQADTGCAGRTMNDTAAVADPLTPVAYYDTTGSTGWTTGAGTTAAAALVAAMYALAGDPAAGSSPASYLYSHPALLNDVTAGADGTCSTAYLCTAGKGYDGPAGVGTPGSAIPFTASGTVHGVIRSGLPNLCLTLDGNTANGTKMVIWTCVANSWQLLTAEPDGTLQIQGKCLDVTSSGTANGTKVQLYTCNGTGAQQWRTQANGWVVNPESGKCLEDPGGNTTNGTQLDIWTCVAGDAWQVWTLPYPVPASTGTVSSRVAGMCLDDFQNGTADGTVVDVWACNGSAAQTWAIAASGTLQINSKCLNVAGGGTANGTKVQLYTCNGSDAQQWRIGSEGALYNPQSGRCLDDPGSSTANGTQLVIWDCKHVAEELWAFPG